METGTTSPFNDSGKEEPTGIAHNPLNGHYFVTNDGARAVREVDLGPDGRLGTSDDQITSFETDAFGCGDAEGITFDPSRGHLFIACGASGTIVEVRPGQNGIFDGIAPGGDDQVREFDTEAFGVSDPEGVDYNPDNDTLFITGNGDSVVLETTTGGALVRQLDLAGLSFNSLAGVAYGQASDDPDVRHLYLADRGVDNDQDSDENDGRISEITLAEEPGLLNRHFVAVADDS